MPVDEAKLNEFLGKALADMGGAFSTALVLMGDKLGLYKAMAGGGLAAHLDAVLSSEFVPPLDLPLHAVVLDAFRDGHGFCPPLETGSILGRLALVLVSPCKNLGGKLTGPG